MGKQMKPNAFAISGRASALPVVVILLAALLCVSCSARKPVTVCILDSGCSEAHTSGESFLGESADLTDSIGHGTNICSLVRQAAPEANVVMLKCFDSQDTVNEEAIVAALYAAVDTYHADVINMSWTLPKQSSRRPFSTPMTRGQSSLPAPAT